MKKLLIIPARGGSKRLPKKNIRLLNGKPLMFYTIDAAIQSNIFDKIIFTSDCNKTIKLVNDNYSSQNLNTHQRPDFLANDKSKVIDTVIELAEESFDQTWLSLPTSPLKIKDDFINSNLLLEDNVDSVISYTEMEFPPSLGIKIDEKGIMTDYDKSNPWQKGNSRSQDHPIVYRPNGAIYGMWTNKLIKSKNFYVGVTKGYYMPRNRSVDIDTKFDFDFAEFLLNI